jgi:hypothetical protein
MFGVVICIGIVDFNYWFLTATDVFPIDCIVYRHIFTPCFVFSTNDIVTFYDFKLKYAFESAWRVFLTIIVRFHPYLCGLQRSVLIGLGFLCVRS